MPGASELWHRCFGTRPRANATRVVCSYPYTRDSSHRSPFPSNRISNTKYTPLSFLPLNLWQQCSQHMNRYFLLIAVLQLWSTITPVAPITTWGPLAVIFAISALKEALDDVRRYRADEQANQRSVQVMRDGRWARIHSHQLLVGDVMRVHEGEEFPADMLLLQSSDSAAGSCYIQTSNLDGETNLKQRFTAHLDELQPLTDAQLASLHIAVECAAPNNNLYNFDATLQLPDDWAWARASARPHPHSMGQLLASASAADLADVAGGGLGAGTTSLPPALVARSPSVVFSSPFSPQFPSSPMAMGAGDGPGVAASTHTFPLSGDNLLLQATTLKNTKFVVGMIVYTGNETKVGCNKSRPHPKYTKLDEQINRCTLLVFACQLVLIVVLGVVGSVMERQHKRAAGSREPHSGDAWYLAYAAAATGAGGDTDDSWVTPIVIPLRFLLLASMMIPISLKVSLDLVKLYYSLLVNWDARLLDPVRGVQARAANTSIAENLGQVRYVLSDKTGTLTDNVMIFRKMSTANGKRYGEADDKQQQRAEQEQCASAPVSQSSARRLSAPAFATPPSDILRDPALVRGLHTRDEQLVTLLKTFALCNTVVPSYAAGPVHVDADAGACSVPSSCPLVPFTPLAASGSGDADALEMVRATPTPDRQTRSHSLSDANGRGRVVVPIGPGPSPSPGSDYAGDDGDYDPPALVRGQKSLLGESQASGLQPSDSMSHWGPASSTAQPLASDQLSASTSFQTPHSPATWTVTPAKASPAGAAAAAAAVCSQVHYASSSPDELSLVEFAAQAGITLLEKNGNTLRIRIEPGAGTHMDLSGVSAAVPSNGAVHEEWEVLQVLEFTSERKRMSVLLRQLGPDGLPLPEDDGSVLLLCKGADDVIFARLDEADPENEARRAHARAALDDYASQGLRTLCFACKRLSAAEYSAAAASLAAASLAILHREAALLSAYESLENGLTLLGNSGIEDVLQEGVADAIRTLREANVKVWMITGDKFETALEISKTCELYHPAAQASGASGSDSASSPGDQLYVVEGDSAASVRACLDAIALRALDSDNVSLHSYCMIVDGRTLTLVLTPALEALFALLALQAVSVICCRVTPAQKAAVTEMVRSHSKHVAQAELDEDKLDSPTESSQDPLPRARAPAGGRNSLSHSAAPAPQGLGGSFVGCLSSLWSPLGSVVLCIGDGGNDCSMIQASDVGVGIVGKEGLQAARAADYSLSRFRMLPRLLLMHGRHSYLRTSFIAQYCFYKSLQICLVQLLFAFVSEFSGASYFDSYSLVTYNLIYTSVPTLLFALEQDLSPTMLEHNPKLYATTQQGRAFTPTSMALWMARAAFQAGLLIAFACATQHGSHGAAAFGAQGQLSNALVIYTACVLIHPLTLLLESSYLTRLHAAVLLATPLAFLVINLVLGAVSPRMDLWAVFPVLLADGEFYLRVMLLAAAATLPVVAAKYLQQRHAPSLVQRAREADMHYHRLHPETADGRRARAAPMSAAGPADELSLPLAAHLQQ